MRMIKKTRKARVEEYLDKNKLKKLLENQTIKNGREVYPDFEKLVKTYEAILLRR